MVRGTIKWWDNNKGIGALVSDEAPGDVWAHLSCVEISVQPTPKLHGGMPVEFDYEAAPQDSFRWVATEVRLLD